MLGKTLPESGAGEFAENIMTVKGTPNGTAERYLDTYSKYIQLGAHKHATRGLLSARESLFLEPGTHVRQSPGFICAIHETKEVLLRSEDLGNGK